MKPFWQGFFGAITALIVTAVIMAQYSNYISRTVSSEILLILQPYQKDIEHSLKSNAPIQPITIGEKKPYLGFVKIGADGTITAQAKHKNAEGQILILVPSVSETEITWKCIGGSNKDVPTGCRSN